MSARKRPRALAREAGDKHYHGRPCKVCGATLKYASTGTCIACQLRPDRIRGWTLKSKYGMTMAHYDALLAKQHGVCAICKSKCTVHDNLSVDHDHETGKTRGLLCTMCNTALGKLKHDPAILQSAIDYVEQHHGEAWYPKG